MKVTSKMIRSPHEISRVLRTVSLFTVLLMTLQLLLSGCQNESDESEVSQKVKLSNVFAGEQLTVDENFQVRNLYMLDGRIFAGGDANTEERYVSRLAEYSDGEWRMVDFPEEVDYQELGIVDGKFVLLTYYFDMERGDSYELSCYEGSDKVWSYDVAELAAYDSNTYVPVSMFCDSGSCYLSVGDLIVVIDSDGKVTRQIEVGEGVNRLGALPDGGIYVLTSTGVYTIADGGLQSGDASLNSLLSSTASGIVDGKLWYSDESGVKIIDDDGERMIVDWLASNLTSSRIKSVILLSEDELLLYGSKDLGYDYALWDYCRVPEDELPEKTVVRFGYVEDGSGFCEKTAILYNQLQDEVYIETIDYQSLNAGDDIMQRFMTDIAAGNAGDVVCYPGYYSDWYETFASSGAICDLTGYIENPDDILGCVGKYCDYNGKIYALIPEFSIETFLSAKGDPVAADGFTMDDILNFDSSNRRLMANMTQANVNDCFLDSVINDCIDYDSATCDFTSDEFIGYAELLSQLSTENDSVDIYSENKFASGEVVLYEMNLSSFFEFMSVDYIFGTDGQILGYPHNDGTDVRAMLSPRYFCSISYSSEVKDEAADFIEYMLSYEAIYDEMRGMRYIPSSRTTLDKICESELGNYRYLYFYKNSIGRMSAGGEPFDETDMEPGYNVEVSEVDYDAFIELADTLDIIKPVPNKVKSIVNEELSAYLSGAQTAETTADIINSRVGTYLAEQN